MNFLHLCLSYFSIYGYVKLCQCDFLHLFAMARLNFTRITLSFAPLYISYASLPRQGSQSPQRIGPQVHPRSQGGPPGSRKDLLPSLPGTDSRQGGVRGVRPRHRLPHPRLSQRGRLGPTTHPRRQNSLSFRGVKSPSSPHYLPKVPLHRLPRRVPHLPLRKKSSTTRLSGYSPLSPTHWPLCQMLVLTLKLIPLPAFHLLPLTPSTPSPS